MSLEKTPEATRMRVSAADLLKGESPCVLTARFAPVAGLDRFQPAGFPEVGHVIYKAPRPDGTVENVCIVDSAASMANHLESVCMRGSHDYDLSEELEGMPYLRCVTDAEQSGSKSDNETGRELVVTSLTEGHRIASTYFLGGKRLMSNKPQDAQFEDELANEFGVVLKGNRQKAHPPVQKWWDVFRTLFKYDPNALVHGVLFPKWNVKIPRVLTAHLEALGTGRVDRSGVKFDRLQKTTSKQPIFSVDDATAREIRATFIIDAAQVRSFGRQSGGKQLGLTDKQKEFLLALALWKIRTLLLSPFRFRSGCHLQKVSFKQGEREAEIDVNISKAINDANFGAKPLITDIFWPRHELYQDSTQSNVPSKTESDDEETEQEEND